LIAIRGDWDGRRQVLNVDLVKAGKDFFKALKDRGLARLSRSRPSTSWDCANAITCRQRGIRSRSKCARRQCMRYPKGILNPDKVL
jgi:hypothetical protein